MASMNPTTWWLLLAMYALLCLRITIRVSRLGKNPFVWFFLILLTAGIPAIILFIKQGRPRNQPSQGDNPASQHEPADQPNLPAIRCPHCRAMLGPQEIDRTEGTAACPRCHMHLDEANLA